MGEQVAERGWCGATCRRRAALTAINAVTTARSCRGCHVPAPRRRSGADVLPPAIAKSTAQTATLGEPEAVFSRSRVVVAPATACLRPGRARTVAFSSVLPTVPATALVCGARPMLIPSHDGRRRSAPKRAAVRAMRPFPRVLVLSGHRNTSRQYRHGTADAGHGGAVHEYRRCSQCLLVGRRRAARIRTTWPRPRTDTPGSGAGRATGVVHRRACRDDPAPTSCHGPDAPRVRRQGAYPHRVTPTSGGRRRHPVESAWTRATGSDAVCGLPDPAFSRRTCARQADALRGHDRCPKPSHPRPVRGACRRGGAGGTWSIARLALEGRQRPARITAEARRPVGRALLLASGGGWSVGDGTSAQCHRRPPSRG